MSAPQAGGDAVRDTGAVDRDNPWPGLAAFREIDQAFFHGRDQAIDALTELVTRGRLSVLYGASGLGKTSLIRAGLFPRARAHDLFPIRIRLALTPTSDPLAEQVCLALAHEAADRRVKMPARQAGETLWEFFYRKDAIWWNERHHIVTPLLVFDQFEEIFTIGRRFAETARTVQAFLDDLRGIVLGSPPEAVKARCDADPDQALLYSLSRCPARVLFSFREDYLAEFLELRDAFPAIGDQNYRLLGMSTGDALTAIRTAGGPLVDEAVARRIVQIIAAAKSARTRARSDLVVDPALLSVFCRELNNERRSKPQDTITDDLLQDKQERILENFYARSFAGLDRQVQIFVENELLLPDSAERNSVAEQVALRRPGVTAEAIESLIDRRLLRRDERDGPARLELAHDVLIEPARRSRDARLVREADERRLAEARAAEDEARRAQEREHQRLLLEIERARAVHAGSEVQYQRERRQRVQRFLAVVTALAIVAAFQWYRANQEGMRAKRALASAGLIQASSTYEAEGRNDIALAYLGYAAGLDPENAYTRGRLLDSLLHRTWPVPLAIVKHDKPVVWAQFAAGGASILTGVDNGAEVQLWSTDLPADRAGRKLGEPVVFWRVGATGQYVLAITAAGEVQVWDAATGRTRASIGPDAGRTKSARRASDPITAASFDRAASLVATGTHGGAVQLWAITTAAPQLLWTNTAGTGSVRVLQLDEAGSRLFAWSDSGVGRVIDAKTGQELGKLADLLLSDAQFAPGAAYFVTVSSQSAMLWRVPDAPAARGRGAGRFRSAPLNPVATLNHEDAVRSAQFSRDGTKVVTASEDRTAQVWDAVNGGRLTPPLRHRSGLVTAAFSADGSRVVTASRDKSARVWDAETGSPLSEPLWHDERVESALFSADGQRVITASDDGTAEVWDVRAGSALPESVRTYYDLPAGGTYTLSSAQFSPDSSVVLLSGAKTPTWRWKPATGQMESDQKYERYQEGQVSPQFSRDGRTFLTADGHTARLWSTATGEPAGPAMDVGGSMVLAARLSPDGERIATIDSGPAVRFWDARSGSAIGPPIPVLEDRDNGRKEETGAAGAPVVDLATDLTLVAVGIPFGDGTRLTVLDISRNRAAPVTEITAPPGLKQVVFDPAHDRLLGIFDANSALVWQVRGAPSGPTARLVHEAAIVSARFSPTSDRMATASNDSTARLWTASGSSVAVLRHDQPVESVDFSPDGVRVATSSRDGTVRLWDAATGNPAGLPLAQGGSAVLGSAFSADGEQLVTTCDDGFARLWHVPVGRPADVPGLASLANAVSGYEVQADGTVGRLDPIARLHDEQRKIGDGRGTASLPARVGAWLLADRWTRTISPFSGTSIEKYLKDSLSDTRLSTDDRRSRLSRYAGHPAIDRPAGVLR